MKRVIALNFGLIATLGFLMFNGLVPQILWQAWHPLAALAALAALGVVLLVVGAGDWAAWISNHMTRFGMIGTLIGMIGGLTGLNFSGADVAGMATELVHQTGFAFISTLVGVIGNIWLNLNTRIKGV